MYELTTGDMRTVSEATAGWKMYVYPIMESMKSVPQEVKDRIRDLEETYRKDFFGFFRDAMDQDDTRLAGEVQQDFEAEWTKDHPEFYDVELLFKGCSSAELKTAKRDMDRAKSAFTEEV